MAQSNQLTARNEEVDYRAEPGDFVIGEVLPCPRELRTCRGAERLLGIGERVGGRPSSKPAEPSSPERFIGQESLCASADEAGLPPSLRCACSSG